MSLAAQPTEHRVWRAPREDGSALIEPPLEQAGAAAAENIQLRQEHTYDFQGRSLTSLAQQARRELVREARRWTSTYSDVDTSRCRIDRLFLAGHQPQLFHPGVWFKNFALDHLARRHDALGINLLIDSDTIKTSAVWVPSGTAGDPRLVSVPLDTSSRPIPYEERKIANRGMFVDFSRRVAEQMAGLVPDPLLGRYWPLAVERSRQTDNLGACLAQSRHQWEAQWGSRTLEVPQGRICQTESFAWLVAHVVAQLPRFREVYNQTVHAYRQANGIRNMAHPVPDLAADGPWLEAPFWVWTSDDPSRRPLFARQQGREMVLADRRRWQVVLPLEPEAHAGKAVARLMELSCQGVKIRSRALMTTLWARLVLGDLFLHGIGGAKYDQVTDGLIERFFGRAPPRYMVLSATMLLPVEHERARPDEPREIDRRLRDLDWHPERAIKAFGPSDGAGSAAAEGRDPAPLIAAKRQWIDTPLTPANARSRHLEIRRLNAELRPWVAADRQRLLDRRHEVLRQLEADRILSWREFSFCLYPEETLQRALARLLPADGS